MDWNAFIWSLLAQTIANINDWNSEAYDAYGKFQVFCCRCTKSFFFAFLSHCEW